MTDRHAEGIEKAANQILEAHFRLTGVTLRAEVWDYARAAVTAYMDHAHPVVDTVEELDALPVGTVVLDASGPCQRLDRGEGVSWWAAAGYEGGWGSDEIDLPARVLHWGDR